MGIISNARAEGSEIDMLIEHIGMALDGVPEGHKLIALLASVLVFQKPDLTEQQLADGVRDISRHICLYLDGIGDLDKLTEEEKKKRMN